MGHFVIACNGWWLQLEREKRKCWRRERRNKTCCDRLSGEKEETIDSGNDWKERDCGEEE